MGKLSSILSVIVAVLVLISTSALFIVDEREQAILFQLGEVVDVKTSPGLYFKIPVAQNVRYFDSRILTLDTEEPERFITSEKKNVLVDFFVKWRIVDVRQYYISVRGDEALARTRLAQTVNSSMRDEFGNRTVHEVVSGERDRIMEIMRQKANVDAKKIGVEVVDVRLKRVDLPQEVSESVYRRMEAERKRVANELRSTGAAEAEKIRADADRQREVILAEAYREAQTIMGEGDGQAAAIYAGTFEKSPEFYTFYRSLEAYKKSFKDKQDMLVLEPSSEFFKYLNNPENSSANKK
ncbi:MULTISPECIES: protease modulator HflC [Nitrosomonas]|uniref:Protein HflC n=1 Tax=Nitrosomonas communis TaxID=44574 RepID=A0A0F7KEX5_9PROT|nr:MULTISPECIES: protease modulator HflC [Nitrosomonas]AKH37387.1 membrane protein [Nitrosomonas communis]TYP91431.1 membrane protease subunit HflC [Nitrosomonas communis]UVS62615.1 protease modulator HflC [Nitrosomonas sp. PLL12]SDW78779.1 membrane protease subunit HflC [Nitrosomonas communis]